MSQNNTTRDEFSDRTILVTGSSRGIGAATAKELAERGGDIVVNYHTSEDRAEAVVDSITDAGGEAIAVQADVRDPDAISELVATAESAFGTIDVLVNNANISFSRTPLLEHPWEEFRDKLVGEIRAAYNCTQAVAPGMLEQGYGRIVYVSSEATRTVRPGFGSHVTAKSALNGLARSVATELASEGVVANVVSPGPVRTDASADVLEQFEDQLIAETPMGDLAEPRDVARTIALFASDDASFVTGTHTPVSGGLLVE